MRQIYLDNNATTPIAPAVLAAIQPFLDEHYGNPSSGHALGLAAHAAIEDARIQVADLIGADPEEIVFTGGGTESNNLAIKGLLLRTAPPIEGHLVISSQEHPAITEPARYLEGWGIDVTTVPCNKQGLIDPQQVAAALRVDTRLVSIMHANNEIGVIQPIADIAAICREHGIPMHTDAAQSVGKIRTVVDELGVDLLTIAGHKVYAPKGVGALFVRRGVQIEPVLHGAGHERDATRNRDTPYIVALGCAAEQARIALDEAAAGMAHLRDRLWERLSEAIPGLTDNGHLAPRLPNTLSANFPKVVGADLLHRIPELCALTGAACHGGAAKLSATLASIGLSPVVARGTVRLSVGRFTTQEDVDRAAELLIDSWERLSG